MALLFFLATIWAIGVTQVANASALFSALFSYGTLAAGDVIDNDVFAIGSQLTIHGTIINNTRFVALLIGVLIYVLLRSIPMFGWVLGVLITAWGLGAFWLTYRKSEEKLDSDPHTLMPE